VTITAAAQSAGNTSPRFMSYPPIYICAGFDLSFDHSATDIDGDELRYSFCAPSNSGFNPDPVNSLPPFSSVDYINPFNSANPVGGNPQISVDFVDGEISGFPEALGSYVVGVCIEEVRDGAVLSTIRRDFEFNIVNCVFKVKASIAADEEITSGTGNDEETIFVIDSCMQSQINFVNTSTLVENIDSYKWEFWNMDQEQVIYLEGADQRNPSINFPSNGIFNGQMIAFDQGGSCSDTAFIQVKIYPIADPEFSFSYDPCENGPVNFVTQLNQEDVDVVTWLWNFGDGNQSNEVNPTHQYSELGDKIVTFTIEDSNGCSDSITQTVSWRPHLEFETPAQALIDTTICYGDSILILGNWIKENSTFQEEISSIATGCDSLIKIYNVEFFEEPIVENEYRFICLGESTIFGNETCTVAGEYSYTIAHNNSDCDSIIYNLNLGVSAPVEYVPLDTLICFGESLEFFDQTLTQEDVYQKMIISPEGCDSILYEMYLTVEPEKRIEIESLTICNTDSIYFDGQWLFEEGEFREILLTSDSGCDSLERVLFLTLDSYPEASLPEEASIFEGQSYTMELDAPESGLTFNWSPPFGLDCPTCQNPTARLFEDEEYEVSITNETGCSTVRSIQITVDKPIEFYVANVIDPQQRNNNNSLFLQCNELLEFEYDLRLYDRWGNLIFESFNNKTNDPDTGWKGGQLQTGVYSYIIEIRADILPNTLAGTVTLMR